jgi:hypothetical protein
MTGGHGVVMSFEVSAYIGCRKTVSIAYDHYRVMGTSTEHSNPHSPYYSR